ncbi:MAG: winged helix-turn-helix transcriptional regulator [Campylobacteraceae bacterium]|nr:winged helix-turn-helix transcriptional regulator [Campylobacteraceae bacterium]
MDCLWDKEEEHLLINSQVIELSQKEHLLLKLFVKNKGFTVTYEDIMFHLWEDSYEKEISIDSVKNQVSHLRKKLPENCLISVYGKGYILN